MQPVPIPQAVDDRSYHHLRFCVRAFDLPHVFRPQPGRQLIYHLATFEFGTEPFKNLYLI
jgi:hypothetical protein